MGNRALGEFEQLVLLAILRVGEGAYTVPLVQEIEDQTGRQTSHAAVYIALKRLEEKGLVDSRLADSTPERGGRGKRIYEVKPAGRRILRESRDALLRMWDGLEVAE
jgi:PadR family transcriptional regulator PadR